jgi:hypothetical protein
MLGINSGADLDENILLELLAKATITSFGE